jgi:inosose dehydratase
MPVTVVTHATRAKRMDEATSGTHVPHPRLRLAAAPVNWNNNDIPGWRPKTPFPEILDHIIESGYRASEYDASFGPDPSMLRAEASLRSLVWCGSYQWVDFLDVDRIATTIQELAPTLALLNAIDCRNLIVSDYLRPHRVALAGQIPVDGSQSLPERGVQQIADCVHRLADAAAHMDIAVHYHNHVGTWIEAPHEVASLIARLDPGIVNLCFDTGHYAYGGGDAASFIREHHQRIGYLHLKDVNPAVLASSREQGLTFIDALRHYVFSPIGEGSADIDAILDVLVSRQYRGWVVVEQDTCVGDSTVTARHNLEYIVNWLHRNAANAHVQEGGHQQ